MSALIPVHSAADAASADAATIAAGVPSRALMQRAGAAATAEIVNRFGPRLGAGVLIHAGVGNNGGDAWVVARSLHSAGIACHVIAAGDPRTDDARAERELAASVLPENSVSTELPAAPQAGVIVDGLLGTGARGRPRAPMDEVISAMAAARVRGAKVVALDVPSGVDATTGDATGAVRADLTIAFGAMKRGLLVARELAGTIVVVDIGLLPHATSDVPSLVDRGWVHGHIPVLAADAHKGIRRKLVIVGGKRGMAGAAVLAARAALASGIGMVKALVDTPSVSVMQGSVTGAIAGEWPCDDGGIQAELCDWADVVAIGPGMGHDDRAGALVRRILERWHGPVLLDADALNLFAGKLPLLRELLGGRPALMTPHPGEFARLVERDVSDVLNDRFDIGLGVAREVGATVLLKGVPTIISAPDGRRLVSAAGTPALATAGSGDMLSGIGATLLAQMHDPLHAGACAAWAHGRAAELAGVRLAGHCLAVRDGGWAADFPATRGVQLEDVLRALPLVWVEPPASPAYPVLAGLPALP